MESHTLKELVEKYWQGETSLQEDKLLDKLLAENPSSEFQDLREYRAYIHAERQSSPLDDSFDLEIMSQIEGRKVTFMPRKWWVNIAASITLIVGLGLGGYFISNPNPTISEPIVAEEEMTEEEVRLAYEEVKKVLFKASANMNEGMEGTRVLGEFHKAKLELETTN